MRYRGRKTRCKVTCRRGYILLTTVFIIAMVCMLTVGLARYSMNVASTANGSKRELQEKWGAASCQRFALQNHVSLLNERGWDDENESWELIPSPRSTASFLLGATQYNIRLDDESAKLNLNRTYDQTGRQKTGQLVRKYAGSSSLKVNLRPLAESRSRGPIEGALESWEQVFETSSEQYQPNNLLLAVNRLTCWGTQLNYRTADESVITETCKPLIGSILTRKLIEILSSEQESDWSQELLGAGASDEEVQQLKRLLTANSNCQSVWVEAVQENRYRAWLVVREEVAGSVFRLHSFSW